MSVATLPAARLLELETLPASVNPELATLPSDDLGTLMSGKLIEIKDNE